MPSENKLSVEKVLERLQTGDLQWNALLAGRIIARVHIKELPGFLRDLNDNDKINHLHDCDKCQDLILKRPDLILDYLDCGGKMAEAKSSYTAPKMISTFEANFLDALDRYGKEFAESLYDRYKDHRHISEEVLKQGREILFHKTGVSTIDNEKRALEDGITGC